MNPGPELDRLIAEKVMGWAPEMVPAGCFIQNESLWGIFTPSITIAHAWKVVEKLRVVGKCFALLHPSHSGWEADFGTPLYGEWHYTTGRAETAPHAICLAALAAVGVDV